jgi:hypothetical protein
MLESVLLKHRLMKPPNLVPFGTPDKVVDAIFEETNGNAFFVQSVYEHLSDEGRLFNDQGSWRTDIDPASLDVPDSVRLVTRRRIDRLSQPWRHTCSSWPKNYRTVSTRPGCVTGLHACCSTARRLATANRRRRFLPRRAR